MLVQITAQLAVSSPETCCILRKQVSILTIATSMLPLLLSPAQDSSSTTQRRTSKIFRPGGMSWFLVQAVVHVPCIQCTCVRLPDAKHLIKTPIHRVSKRDRFDLTAPSRLPRPARPARPVKKYLLSKICPPWLRVQRIAGSTA